MESVSVQKKKIIEKLTTPAATRNIPVRCRDLSTRPTLAQVANEQ